MTDAKRLRVEITKLRQKIQVKLENAHKAIQRAEAWAKAGEFNKASYENTIADKDYKDALRMDIEVADFDRQTVGIDAKIWEIEQQQNELQISTQYKIDQLERQKRLLKGD